MSTQNPPPRRYDMKVPPRLGCDQPDDAKTYLCRSCKEAKSSEEMNHRRRRTGLITVATICCMCYRSSVDPQIPDPQILGRPLDPRSPDPRSTPRSSRILQDPPESLVRHNWGDSEMASPISNARANRLIAAARSRLDEQAPRIQVTGSPFVSASRPRPTAVHPVAPTAARPVTTMVPYRASAIQIRSTRYNLAATRMRNINLCIGALNEVILEGFGLSDLKKHTIL
ncbi:hypothetical protein T492DRAFT_1114932 [Pavlovales sp. CCMP2436]|nr:hypothetical protein T492DRAFT_1114932 [Pavlovales sp. CCMP2436]